MADPWIDTPRLHKVESRKMEDISAALEVVSNSPYDIKNYPKCIQLCAQQDTTTSTDTNGHAESKTSSEGGGLAAEVRGMMVSAVGATSDVWLPLLQFKVSALKESGSEEDAQALLGLFHASRNDYLSIPILRFQAQSLIDLNAHARSEGGSATQFWNEESVREELQAISTMASQSISKSHQVWDLWAAWELERLETIAEGSSERDEAVQRINDMFLSRLRQPHSNYTSTSDMYSPFVSTYYPPEEYEERLINATKTKELPLKQLTWREGNPKRVREQLDLRAENGGSREWRQYLDWELKAKKPQMRFISAVYERALECAARERWTYLSQILGDESDTIKHHLQAAEQNLYDLWMEYLVYNQKTLKDEERSQLSTLAKRATRCIPEHGEAWSFYMREIERVNSSSSEDMETEEANSTETVPDIYSRLVAMNLLQNSIEDLVVVAISRASWGKRRVFIQEGEETAIDQDQMGEIIQVLEEAIATIRQKEGGDPKMRLEMFLSAFYSSLGIPESGLETLNSACKFYKTSYLAWLNYVDRLISANQIVEARRVFKDASQRKGLDWPEMIWERWVSFEYQFGSLEEIEHALSATKDFKRREDARRQKAWQAQAYAQIPVSQGHVPASALVEHASNGMGSMAQANGHMEVDATHAAVIDRPLKRKRSEDEIVVDAHSPKKPRPDGPAESTEMDVAASSPPKSQAGAEAALKRDRERTTVLVSQLPSKTTEIDVRNLFKDCGEIREVAVKELPNELVATVEFMEKESIPAALTKDKKRIHGVEVSVEVAWHSTLYVTNFREGMDDAEMRQLFDEFGTILDIRWPSKRIKTTRRFCYVQYTKASAAQAALSLAGRETEPGLRLVVLVSDPARKQQRTDAGARELRVTGVVKSVTKADLEKLFSAHGTLKDVRLIPAANNNQTAFVEFETEEAAQKALVLNNHLLKNRRLAVTMADTKPSRAPQAPAAKAEAAARSVRIKNLPKDTQEPLLQQALEKVVQVVRVIVIEDINEAVVELPSIADAGRLVLEHPTLEFQGHTITLSEEGRSSTVAYRGRGRGRGMARGTSDSHARAKSDRELMPPPPIPAASKSQGDTEMKDRELQSQPRGGGPSRGRGRGRPGIGMRSARGRGEQSAPSGTSESGSAAPTSNKPRNQDDFRKMLGI